MTWLPDALMTLWSQHWEVGKIPDPERPSSDVTVPIAQLNVTDEEIRDYRRVMRSFKTSTAVAYDNVKPHTFAQ